MQTTLAKFTHLYHAYQTLAQPPILQDCYISHYLGWLRDDGYDNCLSMLDAVLGRLFVRFTPADLADQVSCLFHRDLSELGQTRWEQGYTELLGILHAEVTAGIHSLGWPPGYSHLAPFDFVLSLKRLGTAINTLPCDVKPACGSGYSHVKAMLDPYVEAWRNKNGLPAYMIHLRYTGTLTREVVGPLLRDPNLVASFQSELDTFSDYPNRPIVIQYSAQVSIAVTVGLLGGRGVGGGIQCADPVGASLAKAIEGHVTQKGRIATQHGVPFLLWYIRPYGYGGSDIKQDSLWRAINVVQNNLSTQGTPSSEWLGILFLDWGAVHNPLNPPSITAFVRPGAGWPTSLNPDSLCALLQADKWPV